MSICDLAVGQLISVFSGAVDCTETDNGDFVLSTPLMYPDRDHIQLYIRQLQGANYLISDFGRTMMKLDTYGFDLRRSPRRRAMIYQITSSMGVRYDSGRFFTVAKEDEIGVKAWDLLMSVYKVSDLVFTVTGYTTATFADEFEGFVNERQIQYERGKQLSIDASSVESVDFWFNHSPSPKAVLLLTASSPGYAVQRSDRVYRTFNELSRVNYHATMLSVVDDRQDVWSDAIRTRLAHVSTVLQWTNKRTVELALGH